MRSQAKVVVICGAVALFGGFVTWRTRVAAQVRPPWYGVVADITSSHSNNRDTACLTVAGISEKLVQESAETPGARLEVLTLGDSSRGGEPLALTAQELIPTSTALSTGKATIRRQQQSYVSRIYNNCIKAPSPEFSAIRLGIERMLENARSQRCGSSSQCVVYVDTDGGENVDVSLQARLQGKSLSQRGQLVPLDNAGVDVRFCGMAEQSVNPLAREGAAGRRQAFRSHQDPVHIEKVWRSSFAYPDQVSFEPFCAQPTHPNDYLQQQDPSTQP